MEKVIFEEVAFLFEKEPEDARLASKRIQEGLTSHKKLQENLIKQFEDICKLHDVKLEYLTGNGFKKDNPIATEKKQAEDHEQNCIRIDESDDYDVNCNIDGYIIV